MALFGETHSPRFGVGRRPFLFPCHSRSDCQGSGKPRRVLFIIDTTNVVGLPNAIPKSVKIFAGAPRDLGRRSESERVPARRDRTAITLTLALAPITPVRGSQVSRHPELKRIRFQNRNGTDARIRWRTRDVVGRGSVWRGRPGALYPGSFAERAYRPCQFGWPWSCSD